MNKTIITLLTLLTVSHAEPANTKEHMPIKAKPGQCFTKSFYPPQYTKTTRIKSKKRVLLTDESIRYDVIPAKYSIHNQKVKISDGTEKIITTPAVYKTVTERILVEPAKKSWRRELNPKAKKSFGSCVESASKMGMDTQNAQVGTCYYEHYQPEKYRTTTSKILASESSQRIEVIPAQYKTVTQKILTDSTSAKLIPSKAVYKNIKDKVVVEPARTEWEKTICENNKGCNQAEVVCLVERPTVYKEVTKKIVLQAAVQKKVSVTPTYKTVQVQEMTVPASQKIITIPAKYKTIQQNNKVEDEKYFWTNSLGKHASTRLRSQCNKICLIDTPAKYKTISKQVVVTPAQSKKVTTPPKYTTVKVKKILKEASFKKVSIPSEYITVVTERERTKGYSKWMPMICEEQLTPKIIRKVQQALKTQGFYNGELTGLWDLNSKSATRAYQKEKGLALTLKLSIETMKSLNVF
ncbi:MAG: Reverse transcriptase [uncultured Sulfurovum sp.]|uniref:Reverse transcriptase n=1 Tax=uncultured Sulfurovum sp. TaxID=269237 RepID=A0A6S6S1U8_9BACT|nr:MAG: Reverse transcriptase [uncultured Sulfurovum sp.]